jgi:4'-phosphopantetheinyl transferase
LTSIDAQIRPVMKPPPRAAQEAPGGITTDLMLLDVDAAERARFEAMLTPEEHRRVREFRFDVDRRRYIVRRGRLREILADRLRCSPCEIPLSCNAFGKPRIEGVDVRFNLSHSSGVALYVVGRGAELGCDIEWRLPKLAVEDVAERFFSAHEIQSLRSVPHPQRVEAFFNCWTRKEAFVKALGLGVSYPLKAFDVSLTPGEPAVLLRGPAGWALGSFEPLQGLQAAVAVEQPQ